MTSGPEPSVLQRAYGVGLDSDYPFTFFLDHGAAANTLRFAWHSDPPAAPDRGEQPVFRSPVTGPEGEPVLVCTRAGELHTLRFSGKSSFTVGEDAVEARIGARGPRGEVEVALFGTVLAFWLELRGVLALHAACVSTAAGAVLLLGGNGGGKTAIAAALMRAGLALVSDDIVPVAVSASSIEARPSYPQMRMWPELARHFLGASETLPLVMEGIEKRRVRAGAGGLGSFCSEATPPAAIYLPVRRDPAVQTGVEIVPVGPAEAVTALVGRSFAPRLTAAAGLQPQRLQRLCLLAERVPVRRLVYPSGFDRLEAVAAAIRRDVD